MADRAFVDRPRKSHRLLFVLGTLLWLAWLSGYAPVGGFAVGAGWVSCGFSEGCLTASWHVDPDGWGVATHEPSKEPSPHPWDVYGNLPAFLYIHVPAWMLGVAAMAAGMLSLRRFNRATARSAGCPRCQYPRAGLSPSAPCPECGAAP